MEDSRQIIDFVNDESNKYCLIITALGRMECEDNKDWRYRDRLIGCFNRDLESLTNICEENGIQMSVDEIEYSEKEISYFFTKIEPKVRQIFEILRLIDRANATVFRRTLFTPDTEYLDEDPSSWIVGYMDQQEDLVMDVREIELDDRKYPDCYLIEVQVMEDDYDD